MNTAIARLDQFIFERRRNETKSASEWMRNTDLGRASSHFRVDYWNDGVQESIYVSVLPGGGFRYTKNEGTPIWSPLQDQVERLVRLVHDFDLMSARSSHYDASLDTTFTIHVRTQ